MRTYSNAFPNSLNIIQWSSYRSHLLRLNFTLISKWRCKLCVARWGIYQFTLVSCFYGRHINFNFTYLLTKIISLIITKYIIKKSRLSRERPNIYKHLKRYIKSQTCCHRWRASRRSRRTDDVALLVDHCCRPGDVFESDQFRDGRLL